MSSDVSYVKSLVTFLDVLGFRSMINTRSASDIYKILNHVSEYAGNNQDIRFENQVDLEPDCIQFSDAIVRVNKVESGINDVSPFGVFFWEVLGLVHAQIELANLGVLVRGGIALGDVYSSEDKVFGPAMVRAYELESKYALYPRIVIDPLVVKELHENPKIKSQYHDLEMEKNYLKDLLCQGDDGVWFVNYLEAAYGEVDDKAIYPVFLNKHRDLIVSCGSGCGDEVNSITSKYLWLAKYHNSVVDKFTDSLFEECGFTKVQLKIGPSDLSFYQDI